MRPPILYPEEPAPRGLEGHELAALGEDEEDRGLGVIQRDTQHYTWGRNVSCLPFNSQGSSWLQKDNVINSMFVYNTKY